MGVIGSEGEVQGWILCFCHFNFVWILLISHIIVETGCVVGSAQHEKGEGAKAEGVWGGGCTWVREGRREGTARQGVSCALCSPPTPLPPPLSSPPNLAPAVAREATGWVCPITPVNGCVWGGVVRNCKRLRVQRVLSDGCVSGWNGGGGCTSESVLRPRCAFATPEAEGSQDVAEGTL